MSNSDRYSIHKFSSSRIASIDVTAIGLKQHHVKALIEVDVTNAKNLLRQKKQQAKVSMTAWLLKIISESVSGICRGTCFSAK